MSSAMIGSFSLGLTLTLLVSVGIYVKFRNYSEKAAAKKIASVTKVMNFNQDAFRQLAVAQVAVKAVRTGNTNEMRYPSGFALMIPSADSTDMRQVDGRDTGMIFFTSRLPEQEIQQPKQELQNLTNAPTGKAK